MIICEAGLYEETEEVLLKNFERVLRVRSSNKNTEGIKKYYSTEEKWKSSLENEKKRDSNTLIEQTLELIIGCNDNIANLIKVYQSILQIAFYVLKKKGMDLDNLNSIELSLKFIVLMTSKNNGGRISFLLCLLIL